MARVIPSGVLRFDRTTARLRAVTFLEGISYVLLLFVAMPLKYWAGYPLAVRVTGLAHGVLFVSLAWLTWSTMRKRRKPLSFGVRIGVAALIPFATFFLDGELAREDEVARLE